MIWRDDGLSLQAAEKAAQQGEGDGLDGEVMFDVEMVKEREEDGVGVPNITVDCSDKSVTAYDKVLQTNKLPSMEEVMALSEKRTKHMKRRIRFLNKSGFHLAGLGWVGSRPQGTSDSSPSHLCSGSFPC